MNCTWSWGSAGMRFPPRDRRSGSWWKIMIGFCQWPPLMNTWTSLCPLSSTRPPARTPTALALPATTQCSLTTLFPTNPVFPNSSPVTEWSGHKNPETRFGLWTASQRPTRTNVRLQYSHNAPQLVLNPFGLISWNIEGLFFLPLNRVFSEILFLYSGQSFLTDDLSGWGGDHSVPTVIKTSETMTWRRNEGHFFVSERSVVFAGAEISAPEIHQRIKSGSTNES